MTQLQELAKRIPASYIKQKPGGFSADYCSHADIQQMLLAKLGPCSQEITQLIRNAEGQVQGVVLRMTFKIDGEIYIIEEIGEVERPGPNDGVNAKASVSDGVKRCSLRVGLGLHLWAQESYVLDKALNNKKEDNNAE